MTLFASHIPAQGEQSATITRVFAGWGQPLLPAAARILQERYARGGAWEMDGALIVVPGGRAGRRLRQILADVAAQEGLTIGPGPEIITPADLPERLYAPALPLATPLAAAFAWQEATRRIPKKDQAVLGLEIHSEGDSARAGIAALARQTRDTVSAEGMTLADAAGKIAALPSVTPDSRWPSLARLEQAYQAVLAEAGLRDREDARLAALASGAVSCEQELFLVGTVDLNKLERAFLRRLTTPVCAVIPAPVEEQDRFDDVGGLRYDRWHDAPISIPDEDLHFVPGPAEEASALADRIVVLEGQYARGQITVGVGDESAAESLARRLAVMGFPAQSPFGRPLVRVRPAALLQAVRDYLHAPTARNFAALIRHPDLELWLTRKLTTGDEEPALLDLLDQHLAAHLPERLADGLLPTPLREVRAAIETLLAPFNGPNRRLSEWAGPITDFLGAIYDGNPVGAGLPRPAFSPGPDFLSGSVFLSGPAPEDRQLRRGLAVLDAILNGLKSLPDALAPTLSGLAALAYMLSQAENIRLPSDEHETGTALALLGWLELALDDAPVLLLTGLHGGRVPADTGDDPLLPDSLRRRLGLADNLRRHARDGFLLRVMRESRKHVQLIVTRRGVDGVPQMPSRLLFACDGLTAARRALRFADSSGPCLPARPLFTQGNARRLPPPRPQPLPNELHKLRVTAFRDYLACPYRFYLRHILKLDERDDSADEMDAPLFGELIHDTLAAFARSRAAYLTDDRAVADALRAELARQSHRRFGPVLSPPLQLQVRQAGRRLDAFARRQAESVRNGWQSQEDLSERDLEAALIVDGKPFIVNGRLDRVDYCAARDTFRIIDYKTGDSGKDPEAKHRAAASDGADRAWTDLQLPLYRKLLEAQGVPAERIEVGYMLLAAELKPVEIRPGGRHEGGSGFVPVPWTDADYAAALACAENVIRNLRAGVFWPPAAPPRFTDPFSGLCLDTSRDRADWLAAGDSL